ncbi:unnamed protein product [Echinostoma caproni]|uniref:DDE-1 domain-containing protein n=1 Tax=Echinostoma caproni TaxID=27848 RepID=A0A183A117_9TREM|nr:unnamed protein product [Echinostoma caproni]
MDQGEIWSFKCSFRKHLLEYVLSLTEDEQRIMKPEVDILMAMHLIKKAWVSVHPHVLFNAFMKARFKSTLMQPVMQPPEDKCDFIENFTDYVSIDDRLFGEEIACLEFDDEEVGYLKFLYQVSFQSLDEFVSHQAKHRKDECEAVNVPEVISIRETQKLFHQLKLFALANARSSGRLLECTIDLNSAFVDSQRRTKLR